MAHQTYCIECGRPLAVFGVGAFTLCERCALTHGKRVAEKPVVDAGTDLVALRASMQALGLSTADLDNAILDSAEARAKEVAAANARRRAVAIAARQTAALQRIADAALAAARTALAAEHAADPEAWRDGWYACAGDSIVLGGVNAPDVTRDPACNLGTLTLTATRTRR